MSDLRVVAVIGFCSAGIGMIVWLLNGDIDPFLVGVLVLSIVVLSLSEGERGYRCYCRPC